MTKAKNTSHLIAPEFLPALDVMPTLECTDELVQAIRAMPSGAAFIDSPPLTATQESVNCEERFITGHDGAPDVRVLHYCPSAETDQARPAYLHIHGGGYILGSPEMTDIANRSLVLTLDCVVVSVDYRLAPETRYPGAIEDCYAALRWLNTEAKTLNIDPKRIAIGGESAGGGHAAALALLARRRNEFPVCLQLLDCPMLDDRTGSNGDDHPYCGEFIWTAHNNRYGWQALLGLEPGSSAVPAEAVPARVKDLSGLPPTFITIGALDLFLEESMEYARRLIREGVTTELHIIPGAFHGYQAAGSQAPQVKTVMKLIYAALARAWDLNLPAISTDK
ncbi:MAG: acetyl esterase/lipase [Bermanella sp.]|jgi:acetyl esterase/lipase